jgi:TorA maturation chaperone TorD
MPTPSEDARCDVDLALCRATLWSALALGFRGPTDETVERLTRADAAGALAEAARLLDAPVAAAHQLEGVDTSELSLDTAAEKMRPATDEPWDKGSPPFQGGVRGGFGAARQQPPPSPLLGKEGVRKGSKVGHREGGPLLEPHVITLARPRATVEQLGAEHRRLFGHTARGEVPPYETEYGNEALFQQPQELGDLAGFMRAFGLTLRAEAHERIDHVSCECEFLAFLACKEAYATEHGDEQMRTATLRATQLFLRDHVGRFAPALARRLETADRAGFYGALGRLLLAFVEAECARYGIPVGPQALGLRPDPAACAAPMGCAAAESGTCGFGE